MQIIRSSRECRWVAECEYCGCVFIYKGDEVEEAELPAPTKVVEDNQPAIRLPVFRLICQVMCPECHKNVQVASKAKYRKPAVFTDGDDWEVDEYAGC